MERLKYQLHLARNLYGNGVVDGADGNVKQLLHQKTMNKGKDRVVVQDAFTFTNEVRKLMKEAEVIDISTEEILQFSPENPFEDSASVPGIPKMYVISVISEKATTTLIIF